jgi:RNA polymerase sigma-70 factor (ECF subfamily)
MTRGEPATHRLTEADLGTHYARLRRQARRIVRDDSDADDVVQDAMERAWRVRDRFASEGAAGPWLSAITRRTAIDFLRNRRAPLPSPEEPAAAHERTEAIVLRRETSEALDAAIGTLAPVYRDTLVLHDVLGYSSREIALRESLPYHTVRTHLFRARRALRGILPVEDAA